MKVNIHRVTHYLNCVLPRPQCRDCWRNGHDVETMWQGGEFKLLVKFQFVWKWPDWKSVGWLSRGISTGLRTSATASSSCSSNENVLLTPGVREITFLNFVSHGIECSTHTGELFSPNGFTATRTWLALYLLSQWAVQALFHVVHVILCTSVLRLYDIMVCAVSLGRPCPRSVHMGRRTAALALQAWVQTHPLHSAVNTTNSWWHTS